MGLCTSAPTNQTFRRTRLLLFLSAIAVLTGCVTPVAVRSMSTQLVRTQLAYSLSLRGYFAAVEKFADAQVKIADYRIDEITSQMNREFGRRAAASTLPARRKNASGLSTSW